MARQAVMVTGMGAITPLGLSVNSSWQALIAGQTGVGPITHFITNAPENAPEREFSCQVAAEVKGFDPASSGLDTKDQKKADRFILLGLAAVKEALTQAGLAEIKTWPTEKRERVAVVLGTGIGGLPAMEEAYSTLTEKGPRRVSPFFIPAMLPNLLAGQASILYGLQGANVCPVSACATSAHAIGWGKRLIESNEADVVVVGGAEATICATAIAGFGAMRALSTSFNSTPTKASRPFDAARDGFVMGEGAAVLILESATHAAARGAKVLAKLTGFGQTADASHITLASGTGSRRAMELALAEAGLQATDISAINAHATSTPLGDAQEAETIASVFGPSIPTSATKGATGHLLGAAGSLEAVFSIQSLITGVLPPTLNAEHTALALTDIVPNQARHNVAVQHILSNSFGFGGTNVSLVFSKA